MGRDRVRYFVVKRNRNGSLRFYWQPDDELLAAGWHQQRLAGSTEIERSAAAEAAMAINRLVDDWRTRGCPRRAGARPSTGSPAASRGTVEDLVAIYMAGPGDAAKHRPSPFGQVDGEAEDEGGGYGYDFTALGEESRRTYRRALGYISQWLGPLPVRAVTKAIVLERLTALSQQRHEKGPHKGMRKLATAQMVGRVGSIVWAASSFLLPKGHPCFVPAGDEHNPWRQLRARGGRRRKPLLWSRAVRDAMVEAACQEGLYSIAAAIKINWWIGQREGDVLRLPANLSVTLTEAHEIRQGKTAASVHLPIGIVPEVVDTVRILRAWQAHAGLVSIRLLVDERTRRAWTEGRFRKTLRIAVRARAIQNATERQDHELARALETATFRLLRHTAVTMLYRAGATIPEIASITGHTIGSVEQIIERYGQRDAETAGNAFRKRMEREGA